RFWEMHDMLYERQTDLNDQDLVSDAAELSLDLSRFQIELAQDVYAERIREDFMSGVRSGVNGTPTFFINGHRHDGGYDLQSLSDAILAAMSARTESSDHRHHRPNL